MWVQVTKSFLNENKRMQGWNPQKPTKLDRNDTTSHFTVTYTHVFVSCVQRRVVEGSVMGSTMHVDVHGEGVMLWVAAMYIAVATLSMADMVCLAQNILHHTGNK